MKQKLSNNATKMYDNREVKGLAIYGRSLNDQAT